MSKVVQSGKSDRKSKSYIMIAGPTASGKSQVAVSLAKALGGEIINADSMQLYADLSVLTARPSLSDRGGVPHHLYGVVDGAHRASVVKWLKLAADAMMLIRNRGKLPIVVGGTGMYLEAAINGIAPVPEVPAAIHDANTVLYQKIGGPAFWKQLAALDLPIAERITHGDSQRLIRAMSVITATGTPLSAWQTRDHKGALIGQALKLTILPSRDILYRRINERFNKMLDDGAIDEVRCLAARDLDPSLPLTKALGLSALKSVLEGKMTMSEAEYISKRDSRRYAKRQMTWLRNNYNAQITIKTKLSKSLMENIFSLIC
ncbi:tRNA (adenosine(37)-N6)-dimethylallyltransferase MiaA [Candidatus Puniceispirillum sp.]|nr:tRNA (adenosine(37)-N6)-dimethylallyltransferase MiaA [Candidatus Puniceispirillum sp.]